MLKRTKLGKHLSLGMAIILSLTFSYPASADNTSVSQKTDLKSSSPRIATEKVSSKLSQQFADDEYVTYLVKMKEQADTTAASKNALQKFTAEKATPAAIKLARRSSVISSLRETASRSQQSLEHYLKKELEQGGVKDYKSFFIVNAMAVTSSKSVMENIAQLPEVDKILPNEERFLDKVEIDKEAAAKTDAVKQDKVKTDAIKPSNVEWNISQVNAPEVWAKGIDGTGIVVANLDSGVEYTHPALKRKWRGLDASGNVVNPELSWYDPHSRSPLPADTDGHGTHTMGTMVGSEENGTNQIGVAPGAKWIAVRIFNPSTTDAIILDGAQWLLAPKDAQGNLHPELAPDVVNNSWSGGAGLDEWFRPMVQAWRDAQIFPEFSAGNKRATNPGGPGSVANPANYPEAFATGATDINKNLADFSLLGPSPYGEIKPEVSAPGVNIRSSVPGGKYEGGWNGTSMAGPHTTAIAALLLQANHSLTVDQLEQILMDTATKRTDSQYPVTPNNGYGHGIVNALDAVGSVLEGVGTVSGKVVTAGDDDEAPVLEHTPLTQVFKGLDARVSARVKDNVAVNAVELFARVAGTDHYTFIPMERKSGDSKDGTYEATIPAFLLDTKGLEYYIRVNDYGNNGFNSNVYKIPVSSGVKPGYFQDFETDNLGFTTGGQGGNWAWGVPSSGPGSAYSGQKVVATNLTGTYPASANSYLLAPPIDLTASPEGAVLSFKHWYDLENNIDFGKVYIASKTSDDAFVPLLTFTGSSGGWKTQYVDLKPYAGQEISLMFNLTSDASMQKAGWYIDDLSIQPPDQVAPAAPGSLSASADPVGNVTLTWTPPADEDLKQYKVYRSTRSGAGYEAIGTVTSATYTDTNTVENTTYYYAVTAQDYSGNESVKSNEASLTVRRPAVLFSDSFDSNTDNGWTHGGAKDEWERGVPAAPGPAEAVSKPNVWGTDLDGTYENGADASLVSPSINLTNVTNATLAFQHWFEIESGYDYGYVEISTNGGDTWSELGKFSHNTSGKQWSPVYYNLDKYTGKEVQIRFRLKSDNTVSKAGWYIDNFQVLNVTTAVETENTAPELNLQKPKPVYDNPLYKISRTEKSEFKPVVNNDSVGTESLPASATVTVLETGRSVKTDASTGRYSLTHVAGNFTLKAEAYGYYPRTQSVTITDGTDVKANFNLEAIPHGQINGTVTDERTGQPVAGAVVVLLEDARVAPVTTNVYGAFNLDVMEGSYTLSVTAKDYYGKTAKITVTPNGTVELPVALKPFIGFPGEIAYDDGTPENARAFNAANNAWAVRMTPESGSAQVTGVSFRFWNTEWPRPGGTAFQYAIYDASGDGGAPGRQLAGPFDGTALRNNQWTTLDLAEPVTVQGDFYVVYIQTVANPNSPGLATDESGKNALRSWQRVGGVWSASPKEEGNYMIRAVVRYPVNAPVITAPADDIYTKQPTIAVTGTSPANGATIRLYNGTEVAGTATVQNGQFSLTAQLKPGANLLSAEAVVGGKATDRSEPVTVTLDQTPPELVVLSPVEGARTNSEVLHVTGTANDQFFGTLTVNGQQADIGSDGTFAHRILINQGQNLVTVTAKDLADNETTVTRAVYVDLSLPKINNLSPAADVRLTAGEPLHVSFDSAPGLNASFRVELPLLLSSKARNEIPLTETRPGHYEGTYQTPSSLVLNGGVVVVRVWDQAGNHAEFEAPGKVYVTGTQPPANVPPVAAISAPDTAKKKQQVTFNGSSSRDADGKIVRYEWRFGDGGKATGVKAKHRFAAAGTYTVQLTVTDDKGAQNTAVHNITIK
ncbi:S8 family serine peptidase [Paenibacillus ehimensis]|uniref:S8 family serine peptidase n=1 Tax=Paenibacillus ehimensis TaxID=79264 RepID=UPI002DB8A197|nr:S8 family serine peptidase [Paenibacillus ehimensis]MEC0211577.1 S8 family serine peptidase [Paenibacillus ehimensis]